MKIGVIGDGAWGTALACVLLANGHEVTLWGPFPDYLEEMQTRRENVKFLPGIKLPDNLKFTSDPAETVQDASILLFVTPTQFLRQTLKKFAALPGIKEKLFVNAAKGIEKESWFRISEMMQEELGTMSMNYVVPTLLELGGLPKSPYYSYLLQTKEQIPVLSSYGVYYDAQGNLYKID